MKFQSYKIAIPVILEVSPGTLGTLAPSIRRAGLNKIVVFLGDGIRTLFGERILPSLRENPDVEILKEYDFDNNDMKHIVEIAFSLPSKTEAVIGIGGGRVLDVAKYVAFLKGLPMISVPTSTAHDGFASSGCSLFVNGRRTSVSAQMPTGIIVDTDVIKNAPEKYLYSGMGDIVSKITAIYDWQFEAAQGKAEIDDFAVLMAKKSVNSIVKAPFRGLKDDLFIRELVDSLTMSGIAMEVAGNSAPASGSEHLISHALDQMTGTPQLHGIQVGVATYLMSLVQDHRHERIANFFNISGFFAHTGTLGMKAADFSAAIDAAPDVKPNRHTYLHVKEYREKAKGLLHTDPMLKNILME
jgi:glycerol-1-phosphate dehydrogenase [NAD(P)+]